MTSNHLIGVATVLYFCNIYLSTYTCTYEKATHEQYTHEKATWTWIYEVFLTPIFHNFWLIKICIFLIVINFLASLIKQENLGNTFFLCFSDS